MNDDDDDVKLVQPGTEVNGRESLDEGNDTSPPVNEVLDILPIISENNLPLENLSMDSHFDLTDTMSNLHLVELPGSRNSQISTQNNEAACLLHDNKQSLHDTIRKKTDCWMGNEMPHELSEKDNLSTCGNIEVVSNEGLCMCDKRDEDFTICSKCFLLQNVTCFCDGADAPTCSNCHCVQSLQSLGNLCSCDVVNETICGNCFFSKNIQSGSKRKSEEACYPLHMQLNQSEELLEESCTWLSESYWLTKKAKIPGNHSGILLESLEAQVNKIDHLSENLTTQIPLGEIGSKLDAIEYVLDQIEDFDEVTKLNVQDMKIMDIDEEESRSESDGITAKSTYSFLLLPLEIQLKIFSYFTQRELCRYVAPICSSFFHLSKDISFWQHLSTTPEYDDVSSDLLVRVILSWCINITKLELNRRNDISVAEFREIFQNCRNIQHLSLASCTQVGDEILNLIGTYCKRLTNINFEGCNGLNDNSFYHFIGLPLTCVNVSHCNMLRDDGGVFLVRNFKNLVEINFDGIQWMSEQFVETLVTNHYKTLEKVFLDGENLGDDVVRQLSRCTQLR